MRLDTYGFLVIVGHPLNALVHVRSLVMILPLHRPGFRVVCVHEFFTDLVIAKEPVLTRVWALGKKEKR